MKLTDDLFTEIIRRVASGESITHVLKDKGLHPMDFYNYKDAHPSRAEDYARALSARVDADAMRAMEIADTEMDPQRARVRVDTIKWFASKIKPQVYGERIDLNVNQTVDVGGALAEARARLVPSRYPTEQNQTQVIDVTPKQIDTSTDAKSGPVSHTPKIEDDDIFK